MRSYFGILTLLALFVSCAAPKPKAYPHFFDHEDYVMVCHDSDNECMVILPGEVQQVNGFQISHVVKK